MGWCEKCHVCMRCLKDWNIRYIGFHRDCRPGGEPPIKTHEKEGCPGCYDPDWEESWLPEDPQGRKTPMETIWVFLLKYTSVYTHSDSGESQRNRRCMGECSLCQLDISG